MASVIVSSSIIEISYSKPPIYIYIYVAKLSKVVDLSALISAINWYFGFLQYVFNKLSPQICIQLILKKCNSPSWLSQLWYLRKCKDVLFGLSAIFLLLNMAYEMTFFITIMKCYNFILIASKYILYENSLKGKHVLALVELSSQSCTKVSFTPCLKTYLTFPSHWKYRAFP